MGQSTLHILFLASLACRVASPHNPKRLAKMVKMVASEEEWKELTSSSKPLVVDFTASWCGPCQKIAPFFEELSGKYTNATFVKVDVDELEDVAGSCGVNCMPTFQVWKDGAKVTELVGASQDKLEALVAGL